MEFLALINGAFRNIVSAGGTVFNLTGSSPALFLAHQSGPFLAVEKDEALAETLAHDINFYRQMLSRDPVHLLPDADGAAASGSRACLVDVLSENASVVTSSKNLTSPLWSREALGRLKIEIRKGGKTERSSLEEALVTAGYRKVPLVADRGEFSRRGWLVDIFPSTEANPVRIEFFGGEVEQIRTFEVATQRSLEARTEALILPAREPEADSDIFGVIAGRTFYRLCPLPAEAAYTGHMVFLSRLSFPLDASPDAETPQVAVQQDAGMLSFAGRGILPSERKGLDDIPVAVGKLAEENRVIIVASSEGQSERLKDLFREKDIILPSIRPEEVPGYAGKAVLTTGRLSSGLYFRGLAFLTEKELFGERAVHRPMVESKVSRLLFTLDDIVPGDSVVHREHGIGRFEKVVRQKIEGHEWELMLISYEDGRLYIPVQDIRNLSKYHVEEGVRPKTDRLGGRTWIKKKERARKKVHEMAERLLSLYADRKVARGFVFSPDTEMHREFDSFFPYEETADQAKAIRDIKSDMETDRPMDRLLCGDVGYGKTEVAMRAAFKAVYDNRQVAVLVPTTILAEQHYRTFRERFSGFPVTVDFLSRFKPSREISLTKKRIARGETDILIGTHSILSKRLAFSRLGLLIVDEEHRFGVTQKERIKELTRGIDVLTLTATPIPRTLHMSLSGIRDISVIETPPEERLSVKSVVSTFSMELVRDAITRELQRDGQVFFVHNRIQDIQKIALSISRSVPSAAVAVAHGQMDEKALEEVMHRFFEGEINVLISTAIIGSGLDIPKANTIIINRAERLGLADLYQLRGRVGRSNVRGYAHFLIPGETLMTEEAKMRIQAIQEMSYLGAGFRLALKDLEIRGAGNIFGPEQSGHIHEIGFDLYMEMLEKAVAELKGAPVKEEIEPEIALSTSAFISDAYIEDITLRLSCYRRIASLRSLQEIADFREELKDRFGEPPEEVLNLLDVMRLKIPARSLSVTKIQESGSRIVLRFSPDTAVQPGHLFSLSEKRKGWVRFLEDGFELDVKGIPRERVCEEIFAALDELDEKASAVRGQCIESTAAGQ